MSVHTDSFPGEHRWRKAHVQAGEAPLSESWVYNPDGPPTFDDSGVVYYRHINQLKPGCRRTKVHARAIAEFDEIQSKLITKDLDTHRTFFYVQHAALSARVHRELHEKLGTQPVTTGTTNLPFLGVEGSLEAVEDTADHARNKATSEWATNALEIFLQSCPNDSMASVRKDVICRVVEMLWDSGAMINMTATPPSREARRSQKGLKSLNGIGGKVTVDDMIDMDLSSIAESGNEYSFTLPQVAWCSKMPINLLSAGCLSEFGWIATVNAGGHKGHQFLSDPDGHHCNGCCAIT